ncbi:hypothetical protein GCM10011289_35490 [Paludibacterium paludis]|uniref:Uncharacterized protein n=1 Tax=Paludibacterium paludis TaxID=1225769 RepID=A0A918P775_9NEIS|nr:hypothetical protein GCM10011289_35490 [Paludibacterium paludis]
MTGMSSAVAWGIPKNTPYASNQTPRLINVWNIAANKITTGNISSGYTTFFT